MDIVFHKINIKNFKSIMNLSIEFEDKTFIYGANEVGKTTIYDAISYVLTGKNSLGISNFDILPIEDETLSPFVELTIDIDGNITIISRQFVAEFDKEKKYNGKHKTICYVNSLKYGVKEFESWIESHICKIEAFKLIFEPGYFTENIARNPQESIWEAQRRCLFSICDIKSDLSLAKSKKRFNNIIEGLELYDDSSTYLRYLKSQIRFIEKQIKEVGSEIQCPNCGTYISNSLFQEQKDELLNKRAALYSRLDLCNELINMKCKQAEKKINNLVAGLKFKMFRTNKTNDEIKECCDILWNNTPYNSLSYSTKFVVGISIALAFQKYYKVSMPIIVDNAESIDLGIEVPVQTIFLIKREEQCPDCGGETGRRNIDGLWICKKCGKQFKKNISVLNGTGV